MSLLNKFKKTKHSTVNCWKCEKCKTENSYTTNVCIQCHSINHSVKPISEDKSESFLYSDRPADNSFLDYQEKQNIKYKCSQCGIVYSSVSQFCPSCGAKARSRYNPNSYDISRDMSRKEQRNFEKEQISKLKRDFGFISSCSGFKHISGLPIAQSANCELWLCEKSLVVYNRSTYSVNYSKITNIESLTKSDIQKHYVDNASGAIVGSMAFGIVGALIGGGTKTINEDKSTDYFAITYVSNGETKCLVFDSTDCGYSVIKFYKELSTRINVFEKHNTEL